MSESESVYATQIDAHLTDSAKLMVRRALLRANTHSNFYAGSSAQTGSLVHSQRRRAHDTHTSKHAQASTIFVVLHAHAQVHVPAHRARMRKR